MREAGALREIARRSRPRAVSRSIRSGQPWTRAALPVELTRRGNRACVATMSRGVATLRERGIQPGLTSPRRRRSGEAVYVPRRARRARGAGWRGRRSTARGHNPGELLSVVDRLRRRAVHGILVQVGRFPTPDPDTGVRRISPTRIVERVPSRERGRCDRREDARAARCGCRDWCAAASIRAAWNGRHRRRTLRQPWGAADAGPQERQCDLTVVIANARLGTHRRAVA